jgi:transcriptional regulator with XRE-family HTH domain
MSTGNQIEAVMDAKNMSVDDLAEKTGLPRMTIYNARRGKNVTISTALKIVDALGVTLDEVWSSDLIEKEDMTDANVLA